MRRGLKIFDSDTHLAPSAETLEPYFDAAMRKRRTELGTELGTLFIKWTNSSLAHPIIKPALLFVTGSAFP
jgi:hypothetical protein